MEVSGGDIIAKQTKKGKQTDNSWCTGVVLKRTCKLTIDRLPPSESGKFKQIVQKINRKLFREHACFSKCMHCELKINNRKNPGITTYIKKDCAKTNMCTRFADD